MDETIEFAVIVKHVTERALLCDLGAGDVHWIPRSVVENGNALEEGYAGTIEVAAWFAEKEGLA